jgi:hypothetical protein
VSLRLYGSSLRQSYISLGSSLRTTHSKTSWSSWCIVEGRLFSGSTVELADGTIFCCSSNVSLLAYCPVLSDAQNFVRCRLKHYLEAGSLLADRPISQQPPATIGKVQEEVSQRFRTVGTQFINCYSGKRQISFPRQLSGQLANA